MERADYSTYIGWDVAAWKPALECWIFFARQHFNGQLLKGLEIGANKGGLSLFFAERLQGKIYSTDVVGPSAEAIQLHTANAVGDQVVYDTFNILQPKYEDNSFDYIVFKSVLGVVGSMDNKTNQQFAFSEIYRMLKPGGVLFFAENLKGSSIHRLARKYFVPWGLKWRYVTVDEINEFLHPFTQKKVCTTGFLTAFIKSEKIRAVLAPLDRMLTWLLPDSMHYIVYGYAVKG